jgi:hypothetical protein
MNREGNSMPDEDGGYNGWTNYPTWDVHLWLTSDEETYNAASGVVADAGAPSRAAGDLKEWIEGRNPLTDPASLYSDLLGWALQSVNWDEVARALGPEEWSAPAAAETLAAPKEGL